MHKCPECQAGETFMRDSRKMDCGGRRRRYTCVECSHRWSTLELLTSDVLAVKEAQSAVVRMVADATALNVELPLVQLVGNRHLPHEVQEKIDEQNEALTTQDKY